MIRKAALTSFLCFVEQHVQPEAMNELVSTVDGYIRKQNSLDSRGSRAGKSAAAGAGRRH